MYPPKTAEEEHVDMDPPQVATGYPMSPGHPPLKNQPPRGGLGVPSEWSTGLFDCTKDPSNCCLTCWCPCIAFGQIAEIVDEGNPSCALSGLVYGALLWCTGCACCYSCLNRAKMRAKFHLAESPCGDCPLHCCCESCALCQEYRELQHRGLDPALGWEGNLRKQQGMGMTLRAPAGQTMY